MKTMDAQRKTKKVLIDELTACQRELSVSLKEIKRLKREISTHEKPLQQTGELKERYVELEKDFSAVQKKLADAQRTVSTQQHLIQKYARQLHIAHSRHTGAVLADRKIVSKSKMSVMDLTVFLDNFVRALKNGTAKISKGTDTIFLSPSATLKLSVKGAVKKNDSKLKIALSWPQIDLSVVDVDYAAWDVLNDSGNLK